MLLILIMKGCPLCDKSKLLFVCKKCITVYGVFDKYENEIDLNNPKLIDGLFINDIPCSIIKIPPNLVIVKLKTTLRNAT